MKKILTLLFVSMLMIAMPSTVFADQNDNEVTGESATVELYAAVASQYTVKLPLRVYRCRQTALCQCRKRNPYPGRYHQRK